MTLSIQVGRLDRSPKKIPVIGTHYIEDSTEDDKRPQEYQILSSECFKQSKKDALKLVTQKEKIEKLQRMTKTERC